MGRIIENIEVVDVEKRKIPSKHYVYIVHVEWSDQCTNVIYRRYSRFFDFQSQLMDMYPEEAGAMDPSKRIIPFLPGKKFFGRSHIREVALKRMGPIAEYCKQIVKLPRKISQCKEVLEFFELEPDDIDPPKGRRQSLKAKKISQPKQLEVYIAVTEYKKQEKGEVTLQVGMLVEIVEKTETGWWFVNVEDEQGWVPSTCLEREDGVKEDTTVKFAPGQEEQYLCTDEFKAETEDELSMEKGAVVDVLEKNLEGWWRVRYNGREGLVPATYLIKTNSVKIRKNKTNSNIPSSRSNGVPVDSGPVIVKSLIDVSDLLKDDSGNPFPQSSVPKITTSSYVDVDIDNNDDDDDDDDGDDAFDEDNYDVPEDDKMYTIQELSKILKEDKQGEKETQKIYESLQSMKSRSLKRNGSTRPPPRPSAKPSPGSSPMKVSRPPLVRAESSYMEYVTIAAFSDVVGDGISFDGGESVKVLEKSETGWWYIEIDGNEGWAPATYIEKVTPTVDKPRAPSPQTHRAPSPQPLSTVKKTHSPARSQEDLTDDSGMGNKRNSSFGNLTNALKAKFKTNKSPPTLPKKDFLDDNDDVEDTAPVSPKTPKSPKSLKHPHIQHSFPAQSGPAVHHGVKPGLKKAADRSMQPPPPAPPGKLSTYSADVSKPDVVNKPMPPVPPAKVGLKPPPADTKPKPPSKPTSDTVKDNSSDDDSKPSPFNIVLKPTGGPHKVDSKPENKPKPNLKPLVPTKKDTKPANVALKATVPVKQDTKPADLKPKPPVKNKSHETADEAIGKVDVAGLAGALKAKFESGNVMNSANDVERPKSGISHKPTVKAKSNKPDTPSKPSLVPKPGQDKPVKPSWVKHSEPSAPEPTTKPSFVRSTADKSPSRESGSSGETRKVSALADALKAKLEIKGHSETAFDHVASRASHPVSQFNKSPTKQFEKPVRPSTPPTQRPSRPNMSPGSRAKPGPKGSNLDPTKYSSRPLPPAPGKAPSNPQSQKALPQVPKKSKPVVPDPDSDSSDSDDDARPSGVSNLANVLKARLGVQQTSDQTKHNNTSSVSMKPKINTKPEPDVKKSSNKYDIENNNTEEVKTEGTYCAIADYPGTNEGEIKLVAGQYFNLLETADGWWYVSSGNDEGWAPSTYLEKVSSDGSVEPAADTEEQGGSSGTDSQNSLCLVSSDFDAENDGELSVKQGEHVKVLESPEGGWWYVKARGNEGWVPASFLS